MMDCQISLENLPQEVLTHIGSYLDVQDILACSSTSTSMRHAFNDNVIWKNLCNLNSINYFKKHTSFEDHFKKCEKEVRLLSPLCHWRLCFITQATPMRNFRRGIYKKELLMDLENICVQSRAAFGATNEHVFFHSFDIFENKMLDQIWDIKQDPICVSNLNFNFNNENGDIDIYEIVGDRLVICQHNIVQVYNFSTISTFSIKLDQAFVFEQSEEFSKCILSVKDGALVQVEFLFPILKTETVVCNQYFFGIYSLCQSLDMQWPNPSLHIWNILDGTKVKEDDLPIERLNISKIRLLTSKCKKYVIVKLFVINHRYTHHNYGYDLINLRFSLFSVKHNYCDFMIFADNLVVGVGPQKLYLYDYKTSKKLAIRNCGQQILRETLVILDNNLLYGTFHNKIFVLNLASFELVNTIDLGFTLYSLKFLCHKFILINSRNSEVWEVGDTSKKLFSLPPGVSFLALNQYCTKIVVEKDEKVFILNFM